MSSGKAIEHGGRDKKVTGSAMCMADHRKVKDNLESEYLSYILCVHGSSSVTLKLGDVYHIRLQYPPCI